MNKVIYAPPPDHVVNKFARDVCNKLAELDAGYADPEIRQGLAGFLMVVGNALANNANRENGEVDNANE